MNHIFSRISMPSTRYLITRSQALRNTTKIMSRVVRKLLFLVMQTLHNRVLNFFTVNLCFCFSSLCDNILTFSWLIRSLVSLDEFYPSICHLFNLEWMLAYVHGFWCLLLPAVLNWEHSAELAALTATCISFTESYRTTLAWLKFDLYNQSST